MNLVDKNDPALIKKSELIVDVMSDVTKQLISDLIATLQTIGIGRGLAAPQIGVNKQLFVYKLSPAGDFKIIINPKILAASGKIISKSEGCLSLPGFRIDKKRYKTFIIEYTDHTTGERKKIRPLFKLETLILQHEYDHLMGILLNSGEKL